MKAFFILTVIVGLLGGCSGDSVESLSLDPQNNGLVRVTGEIESADSRFFGPPNGT